METGKPGMVLGWHWPWFDMKDRLPFESEIVLAVNNSWELCYRVPRYAIFMEGKFYHDETMNDDRPIELEGISHWMPLPVPPE